MKEEDATDGLERRMQRDRAVTWKARGGEAPVVLVSLDRPFSQRQSQAPQEAWSGELESLVDEVLCSSNGAAQVREAFRHLKPTR